jgi:hypothetical protein
MSLGIITYQPVPGTSNIKVRLEGKHVGTIKQEPTSGWYFYKPKGGGRGEIMRTVTEVKRSLEN